MMAAEKRARSAQLKAARELKRRVEAVCLAVRIEQGQARSSRPRAPRAQATRERVLRWRSQRPEGPRAHKLVCAALRAGRLSKPERCEGCGRGGLRLHAHHPDYRQPLRVQWLCCSCHRQEHRRLAAETRGAGA